MNGLLTEGVHIADTGRVRCLRLQRCLATRPYTLRLPPIILACVPKELVIAIVPKASRVSTKGDTDFTHTVRSSRFVDTGIIKASTQTRQCDICSYRSAMKPGYPRVARAGTVGSSPGVLSLRQGRIGYRPELNNSYSSHARFPSPAVSLGNVTTSQRHPPYRTTTPMSLSLQNVRGVWNNSQSSQRGLPKSPTESTGPHYYDYSESFVEEEDCFSPVAEDPVARPPFTMDQTILGPEHRHAQSPFGTLPGSIFKPAELPTKHNRRASEQSKYSYVGVIPPRKSSLGATAAPMRNGSLAQRSIQRSATTEPIVLARSSKEENYDPRTSTASRRTVASTHASAFFSNACRSPRDLTTLAARVHSPGCDDKISARPLPNTLQGYKSEFGRQKGPAGQHIQAFSEWGLASLEFRPLSLEGQASEVRERPKTSGDAQTKSATDILSPVPERPMSSQSRKRFSRIFDIGESFVAEEIKSISKIKTFARLSAVNEQPDLQSLEAASAIPTDSERNSQSTIDGPSEQHQDCAYSSDLKVTGNATNITIHDKSTVESLLDHHIECLGLGKEPDSPLTSGDEREPFDVVGAGKASSELKTPTILSPVTSNPSLRPTTSSSCQLSTSLTRSERRRLMPRRLFASMDLTMTPKPILPPTTQTFDRELPSDTSSRPLTRELSFGWQTLPSSSEIGPPKSPAKISLTSGDLADVDSDPPVNKFKIRRISDMTTSTTESTNHMHDLSISLSPPRPSPNSRRRKSDLVSKQDCHRRRRARILLKVKRKSSSLDLAPTGGQKSQQPIDAVPDDEWETTESPEDVSMKSPVAGYAELSGESVIAQPPTTTTSASVVLSSSAPKRWSTMLAAMPEPVKKSIDIVRKASVRSVRTHRSNTSITNPLNSTRMSSQLPRSGSVPQLAPPEFGPPLTSSNLDLTLRLPDTLPISRPPLRQAQSFFSDNSSARQSNHVMRKRFDLHSLRSGLTRSSGVLGTRGSTARHTEVKFGPQVHFNNRKSFDNSQSLLCDTVPMTDFAFKKRKVLDRFKDWLKRHACKKRAHR
ncbi:hypothetical protein PV08_07323 [Exophiala spinifera]|uniref:Uncharacterized protein n=1 Tax=Exophiala spinifera TaxID=91928 RepID=A0A0D2BTJ2_9EURO|nr:uncharacterized protein PV08_07323 [Exophiala spinifera]KIW14539.1 hypothetical protein PV08_07323 [Exophiala spinifera]